MEKNTKVEFHSEKTGSKLNKLRASVLGANDGIISISGLVVGVAGASQDKKIIIAAGIAGVIAGAISMAAGEYVSVSSQRDTERALLAKEKFELKNYPELELTELITIYEKKGLSRPTAEKVAMELTRHDSFAAHAEAELRIDPKELVNPWQAAIASAFSFVIGSTIPMATISLFPVDRRIKMTFISVILALILTGYMSARFGKAPAIQAIVRVVTGGVFAMAITYAIGHLFNVTGI